MGCGSSEGSAGPGVGMPRSKTARARSFAKPCFGFGEKSVVACLSVAALALNNSSAGRLVVADASVPVLVARRYRLVSFPIWLGKAR